MTQPLFTVALNEVQMQYLVVTQGILGSIEIVSETTVQGDRCSFEELRERLTERMAKFGFDEDYSVTEEGTLIEELIDVFWATLERPR